MSDIVQDALSKWVPEIPIVESLLTKVNQSLINGSRVSMSVLKVDLKCLS